MKKIGFSLLLLLLLTSLLPAQDYLVGEGDVLKITVYDNEDLQSTVRVSGEGTIVVPLLGKVYVRNLSIPRISDILAARYADGYLKNPQVNVFIEDYRGQKVVILGQVNNPGLFELRGTTTFLELISKAGGLTQDAGDKATIKRTIEKGAQSAREVKIIDLVDLIEKGDISKNILVYDGDNIYINKAGFFFVTGEVKKPDAYKYRENTTILKAVALAGGFTGKANKDKIKIFRTMEDHSKVILEAKADEPVQENDVIVITESFW
ncbi:polysaccharide export protein [bacterium]|nr:polysaccharide export protein [bacterium]